MDSKGRISLPTRWRSALRHLSSLGNDSGYGIYVAKDLEYPALRIYPHQGFEQIAIRMDSLPLYDTDARQMRMRFFNGSQNASIDLSDESRLLVHIDQIRRDYGRIDPGAELVLAGEGHCATLWNPEIYERVCNTPAADRADIRQELSLGVDMMKEYGLWRTHNQETAPTDINLS
ncbi:MAG: division/cell wall cluster transcriptional repressor MraZ [Gammaproteobacteria bacterium]